MQAARLKRANTSLTRHSRRCSSSASPHSPAPRRSYKPLSELVAAKRAAMIGAIKSCIERGVASGELDRSADADALARLFGVVIEGMSIQARDGAHARASQ